MSYPAYQPCGTRARYAAGCRCPRCTEANRRYHRTHRHPTGQGRGIPTARFLPPMDWAGQAACAGLDPELFHPNRGDSTTTAKTVCAGCPVQAECLAWALDTNQQFGIWGGMSERERRQIRSRQAGHSAPDFLWTIALILFIIVLLDRLGVLR